MTVTASRRNSTQASRLDLFTSEVIVSMPQNADIRLETGDRRPLHAATIAGR
jgi:hypothetical protein